MGESAGFIKVGIDVLLGKWSLDTDQNENQDNKEKSHWETLYQKTSAPPNSFCPPFFAGSLS